MAFATEKHSELGNKDEDKIYKGCVVCRGDDIRDEFYDYPLFGEISSAPSSMAASNVADAWGCCPGNSTQYSGTVMAYTQSLLGGDPCYVRLPKKW